MDQIKDKSALFRLVSCVFEIPSILYEVIVVIVLQTFDTEGIEQKTTLTVSHG